MIKNLVKRFRKRLKKSETKKRPSQEEPKPVVSGEIGKVSRPSVKASVRDSGRKPVSGRSNKSKKGAAGWDVSQFDVPVLEERSRFHDLNLPAKIMHGIADLSFQYCTPIQEMVLPKTLEGCDATGQAQTGTGKSAAFLVTIYTRLLGKPLKGKRRPGVPRALILAPTRELALQIEKDARGIGKYSGIRILSVFGGMGYESQKRALAEKVIDIIVATPGRLLDFQRQNLVKLYKLEILVIDEADRMLDMGFIPDVRKIVYSTPGKDKRQTLFFGATLTPEVERLAKQWTRDPVRVEIEREHVAADSVTQRVYLVTRDEKFIVLLNLIVGQNLEKVLVFTNRRDQTGRLADRLKQYGINCAVLSGDVPQKKRIRTLEDFRTGKIRVLVATDVAARGLHVEDISHVINFTLPRDAEDYVHRIGRTGRAGATGISVSFASEEDSFYIPPIEEYLGAPLSCVYPEESLLKPLPPKVKTVRPRKTSQPGGGKRPPRGKSRQSNHRRSRSRSQSRAHKTV